jgi:hypothetical protein
MNILDLQILRVAAAAGRARGQRLYLHMRGCQQVALRRARARRECLLCFWEHGVIHPIGASAYAWWFAMARASRVRVSALRVGNIVAAAARITAVASS